MKTKAPEIHITLLSCMLTIVAHNARMPGAMRYSAYMTDGMNRVISHHFAKVQPFVRDQVLVMDDTEIHLHDGAALLAEEFLRNSQAFVDAPRQLNAFSNPELRAIA